MMQKLWSVVFLKTTARGTVVIKHDEEGNRKIEKLPDNTPPRGVYAGEYPYIIPDSADSESERKTRGFFIMAATAAKKIGIKGHGGFGIFANEKARLLEVTPL